MATFCYVFENVRKPCGNFPRPECADRPINATTGHLTQLAAEVRAYQDPVLGLAIFAIVLHIVIYLSRGVVFVFCSGLRRRNEGAFYTYLPKFGDGLTSVVGVVQFLLMGLLAVVYEAGSHNGDTSGEHRDHMRNCIALEIARMQQ